MKKFVHYKQLDAMDCGATPKSIFLRFCKTQNIEKYPSALHHL